jgi:hypothetical protein
MATIGGEFPEEFAVQSAAPIGSMPTVPLELRGAAHPYDLLKSASSSEIEVQEQRTIAGEITSLEDIATARGLVGRVYLKEGYVTRLSEEGFLTDEDDPYVAQSTYFAVKRGGEIVATGRAIKLRSLQDYPAIKEFDVDPASLHVDTADASRFVEISALAKTSEQLPVDVALTLYASMFRASLEEGEHNWLISADKRLANKLTMIFGAEVIGAPHEYMGSTTVPMMLDMRHALARLDPNYQGQHSNSRPLHDVVRAAVVRTLQGLSTTNMDQETRDLVVRLGLEKKDNLSHDDNLAIQDPNHKHADGRTLAIAALLGYTVLRALVIPITGLSNEGVNPLIFLGFDAATVPTYVLGLEAFTNKNNSFAKRLGGLAVAGLSYAAPYAYAVLAGLGAPQLPVALGVFGLTVIGAAGIRHLYSAFQSRASESSLQDNKRLPASL